MEDDYSLPKFPPPLVVDARVWTTYGYADHGPKEGPKVDIAPNMGGTITRTEQPYATMDQLLYSVLWDNGQTSKHYWAGLFCIGRFKTPSEFEAAIHFTGAIELTLGPKGGFRYVNFSLDYDGQPEDTETYNRGLWLDYLQPLAEKQGVTIHTISLPPMTQPKKKKKRAT